MANWLDSDLSELEMGDWKALKSESTLHLIRMIVEESNIAALKVLLETRKLFRLRNGPSLFLPEFLSILRNRIARPLEYDKYKGEIADCTYDLTLAKYFNFPDSKNESDKFCGYSIKFTGVDCRNSYRAFLRKMHDKKVELKISSQAEEEFYAGRILQNLVYNNFYKSKLECIRLASSKTRYEWRVKGVKFTLSYPSYLSATRLKKWLEKNIEDIDPEKIGEQGRIQSMIDKNFKPGYQISMEDPNLPTMLSREKDNNGMDWWEGYQFADNLAKAVAKIKVRNIYRLRSGIQKLGKEAVEQLILEIFKDLSEEQYNVSKMALKYGISKSTLSRFAGSRWFENLEDNKKIEIPDLWQNTVKILAENRAFMEMVLSTGYAGELKKVLDMIDPERDEKNKG